MTSFSDWANTVAEYINERSLIAEIMGITAPPKPAPVKYPMGSSNDPRLAPVDIVDRIDELVNWQLEQGKRERK